MVHDKNGAKFTIHDGSPLAPALVWTGIAVMCAAGCGAPEPTTTGEIERESIGADLDVAGRTRGLRGIARKGQHVW